MNMNKTSYKIKNCVNYNRIIELLYGSIFSESIRSDAIRQTRAIWLTRHDKLSDLVNLISQYSRENGIDWDITLKEDHILWSDNSNETVIICNDLKFYDSCKFGNYVLNIMY
jgi:hypothetical protein